MSSLVLDVENSAMQARWVMPPAEQHIIEQIVRQHGLPEMIARLLSMRGVTPEAVESFLSPRLSRDFPDPLSLAGMKELAVDLAESIMAGRRIAVFGDFDVDGATSTAILVRFFRHCGLEVPFYIPDRMKEGYGPNIAALRSLKEQGAELVILCDCGITAFDVVAQGRDLGLDLVIIDHHEAEEKLPAANHVINPKRRDDTSGLDMLAACGVVFMVGVAVNACLRDRGFYRQKGVPEAPLKNWLDIAALGTVCDMVPLTGVNRLIVRAGFAEMARRDNPGIRALCEVARINGDPSPYHAGFILGPRINAGSRVHKADLGARLLSTDSAEEAQQIAWVLNDCNDKRKALQQEMFDQAAGMVEDRGMQDEPVIIVGHEDWHPGLSGLVAGRLREKYDKPAICITYAPGEGGRLEGRGSGRSVSGINMGAIFIAARNEGIITKGGGHAMAAGFTVLRGQEQAFSAFVKSHIESQLAGQIVVTETLIDSVLSVRGAQPDLVKIITNNIGPFGQENPEPVFVMPQVRLQKVDVMGQDHIRAMISDWEGGSWLKAVAFRAKGTPLGDLLLGQGKTQPLHLAGSLKIDSWNGRESVEMHICDAAPALVKKESQVDKRTYAALENLI